MIVKKLPKISRVLFILFLFNKTVAQEMPNIVPPSPEAISLFKFSEIPVSLYTGLPNINIPLFEIESGGVTIPISISYHARGIQVSEIASRVGTGWTLNTGGMISKQARDVDDSLPNSCGYVNFFTDKNKRLSVAAFKEPSWMELCDMIPDQYSYSVNGMSGKFMYDPIGDSWMPQNYSNLKVSSGQIIDGNGNKYIFDIDVCDSNITSEKYSVKEGNYTQIQDLGIAESTLLANTWHLTQIETAKGTTINYHYTKEITYYYHRSSDKIIMASDPINESYVSFMSNHQQRIESIVFDQGSVEFKYYTTPREDMPGSHALQKIILKDKAGQVIKQALFEYEYTTSTDTNMNWFLTQKETDKKRLFLKSVRFADKDNNTLPPYQFDYNSTVLPSRHSNSVDVWGYFNGKNNGAFLYPNTGRNVDGDKAQAGLLTSIIKPEGGRTDFYYEPNIAVNVFPETVSFGNPNPSEPKSVYLTLLAASPNSTCEDEEGLSCYKGSGVFEYIFNISQPNTKVTYSSEGSGVDNCPCDNGPGCKPQNPNFFCLFSRQIMKLNPDTNLYEGHTPIYNVTSRTIKLQPGKYKLRVAYAGTDPFNPFDALGSFFSVNLTWDEEVTSEVPPEYACANEALTGTKVIHAAGNRIRKIEYKDTNGAIELVKTFSYKDPNTGYTSGRILGLTNIAEVVIHTMNGQPATEYKQDPAIAGMFRTYQNNAVGYKYVTEYYGDENNTIGKTEYVYSMVYDTGKYYEFPQHPPTDNEWLRGKELKVTHYKKNGNNYEVVKKIENSYLLTNDMIYTGAETLCNHPIVKPPVYLPLSQNFSPNGGYEKNRSYFSIPLATFDVYNDTISYKTYYMTGGTFDLKKTKVTDYFDGGSEVVTEKEYFYDYNKHYNPSLLIQSTSNNDFIHSRYFYATSVGTENQDMIDKNMLDIPVKIRKSIGTPVWLSEEVTEFKKWNFGNHSFLAPEYIKTSKGTNSLENRIRYELYDDKGNPLEVKQENGISIVYLWGYNKAYPIAKIENATYDEVVAALGTNNISEADLSAINALRTNSAFANAMITTYTYKPLVGVSSITDPRGYTTTYHYDNFNRLEFVRDAAGNILERTQYHYQN